MSNPNFPLKKFQEIIGHMYEASKIVHETLPEQCLERLAWDVNFTQAAQWVRNYREKLQPKDYIVSGDDVEKQVKESSNVSSINSGH